MAKTRKGGNTRKIPFAKVADMPSKKYITPTRKGIASPDYSPAFVVESPTSAEIEQLKKDEEVHEMQQGFFKRMSTAKGGRKTRRRRRRV
jgi:hypothetical protein